MPRQQRRGVSPTNITFRGIESEALLILLDQEGICGSSGSACLADFDKPSHVVKAMKPESAAARQMIQFSSDAKTTIVDIKATLAAVTRATASVRCLIDADLRRSTKPLLGRHSHEAIDVPDIGLRPAKDPVIARCALDHQACLITGDFAFADIRNYPPETYHGIVVLELPRDAGASFILGLIENFVQQTAIIDRLPGRLAIIQAGRIRLRPG